MNDKDTIYRQAAIDALLYKGQSSRRYKLGETWELNLDEIKEAIGSVPSAQLEHNPDDERKIADLHKMVNYLLSRLEQRWIPVTEELPKEKDAGILKKLGTNKRSDYVIATVEVKGERMTVTACTYDGEWDWNMKYAFPDYKVIAWMPLPAPYQKEGEAE